MKINIKDPTKCPHCGTNATGRSSIENVFGFRNMGNGTIREQSWCKECRKQSSKRKYAIELEVN